jgi:hypothetical protein
MDKKTLMALGFIVLFQVCMGVVKFSEKLDIQPFVQSCKNHSCEFCCLSNFKCGSLDECREREFIVLVLSVVYYSIIVCCGYILIYTILKKIKPS